MRFSTRAWAAALAALLLAEFCLGRAAARPRGGGDVVGVFGVGGVIGDDGALWQYLPDEKRWMTIDEAFQRDGRETHILPLPVQAKEIRFMESWGFLVTTDGRIFQYDLDTNRWRDIGRP